MDDQNNEALVSTLTRTTDSNGNISVTVLSSDLISQPNLIVSQDGKQIGSISCDFAAAQSIRRYGILSYDPQDGYSTDAGWNFTLDDLVNPGDTATATLYLKFQKDPVNVAIDTKYYRFNNQNFASMDVNNDGMVSDYEYASVLKRGNSDYPLDDANNWLSVGNHQMHLRITQITDFTTGANITDPRLIQSYVYYSNAQGVPLDSNGNPTDDANNFLMPPYVSVPTSSDGTAVIYLTAGPNIYSCTDIVLDAVDETQVGQNGNF